MQQLVLWLIALYRWFLSPYKGFRCAHRVHRGGLSCSAFGERAIRRHGVRAGLLVLRRRLRVCGRVHMTIQQKHASRPLRGDLRAQSGDCDLPITDCAMPDDCSILELLNCDCSGCDWLDNRKQKKEKRAVKPSYRQQPEDAIQEPIPDESE